MMSSTSSRGWQPVSSSLCCLVRCALELLWGSFRLWFRFPRRSVFLSHCKVFVSFQLLASRTPRNPGSGGWFSSVNRLFTAHNQRCRWVGRWRWRPAGSLKSKPIIISKQRSPTRVRCYASLPFLSSLEAHKWLRFAHRSTAPESLGDSSFSICSWPLTLYFAISSLLSCTLQGLGGMSMLHSCLL